MEASIAAIALCANVFELVPMYPNLCRCIQMRGSHRYVPIHLKVPSQFTFGKADILRCNWCSSFEGCFHFIENMHTVERKTVIATKLYISLSKLILKLKVTGLEDFNTSKSSKDISHFYMLSETSSSFVHLEIIFVSFPLGTCVSFKIYGKRISTARIFWN